MLLEKAKWIRKQINHFKEVSDMPIDDPITNRPTGYHQKFSRHEHFYSESGNGYYELRWGYFIINRIKNSVRITNIKTGKTGVAYCNKHDMHKYNPWFGIAIAWANYKRENIPTFYKEVLISTVPCHCSFWYDGTYFKKIEVNPVNSNLIIAVRKDTGHVENFDVSTIVIME